MAEEPQGRTAPAGDVAEVHAPGRRRRAVAKNVYGGSELAGAFGDLGTLIPFIVGYIAVAKLDPLGILFTLGVGAVLTGVYYRTPIPVQPMKAIGAAVVASGGTISVGMVCGAGLFTGAFWLVAGLTNAVGVASRVAARPVVRGIVLGLGLLFIAEGVEMMLVTPWLGGLGLVLTFALLAYPRFPAMFALLLLGVFAAYLTEPSSAGELLAVRPTLRVPRLVLGEMSWGELVAGSAVLAIPQIPLTMGNAVIAIRSENNRLFPDRPVTDRMVAISQGLLNLASAPFGGIPVCHGAGGMAGHVRFGARTGGSLVMFGAILIATALFLADAVALGFEIFPTAVLGVILFFAGAELALAARDLGRTRHELYVTLVVAGVAMWNMGAAFLAGVVLHEVLRRGWIRV